MECTYNRTTCISLTERKKATLVAWVRKVPTVACCGAPLPHSHNDCHYRTLFRVIKQSLECYVNGGEPFLAVWIVSCRLLSQFRYATDVPNLMLDSFMFLFLSPISLNEDSQSVSGLPMCTLQDSDRSGRTYYAVYLAGRKNHHLACYTTDTPDYRSFKYWFFQI